MDPVLCEIIRQYNNGTWYSSEMDISSGAQISSKRVTRRQRKKHGSTIMEHPTIPLNDEQKKELKAYKKIRHQIHMRLVDCKTAKGQASSVNILYRKKMDEGERTIWQMLMPESEKENVLRLAHDDMGHLGRDKT